MSISGKGDSLDEYMKTVSNQLDKRKQSDMKLQIHQLKKVFNTTDNSFVVVNTKFKI